MSFTSAILLFSIVLRNEKSDCSRFQLEVRSNKKKALIFFRLLLSNCLNWKIYCDDHFSLSSTTAVQNELFQEIQSPAVF